MTRILIVGNPESPLVSYRGLIGQKAGHEIFWFSPQPANLQKVRSFHLPVWARKSPILRAFLEPLFLSRTLKDVRPDLVHVHYASKGLSAIPLSTAKHLVVSVMGSDILQSGAFRFPFAPFTRRLLNTAEVITSKSHYLDLALSKIGNYQHKIRRVTWGVDLKLFNPEKKSQKLRRLLGIDTDSTVFFEPRSAKFFYNKHVVIDALQKVEVLGGPKMVVLMATGNADANYLSSLKKQADHLGVNEQIRWLSKFSKEEMAEAYSLADGIISAPKTDGMPQSFYEGIASGSFLIVGDLPQYAELVDNCPGIATVPVGDPSALAQKMIWLARNPEELAKAARANREYAQRHLDQNVQETELLNLYSEIIN